MTVLLKQLEIHGFKSFATPTTFVFDRGITAVIGPNGSGKSNVAEALRWVLGEQGYTNLRSRRTEDVIFAGSDKRAQLALAEVTLILDNPDGELPLPFTEISITRRAFRSGESQYLINGSRVRLKDIQQLVASLGQAYTIIGQGLVDAALSQRPEERRGLFEHAAGISGLRLRANEAERGLNETSANALRLRDILSELEPRVRSLERQARMAREYGAVRDRLHDLHRRHYAALWRESSARVRAARLELHETDTRYREAEQAHTAASQRLAAIRGQERSLVEQLGALTDQIAGLERSLAETRHQGELLQSEARAASQRLVDLQTRRDELEREREQAAEEAIRLRAEAAALECQLTGQRDELAARDAAASAARARRSALQAEITGIEQEIVRHIRDAAEAEGQVQALAERQTSLDNEARQIAASLDDDREQRDRLMAALVESEQQIADIRLQIERIVEERARIDAELIALRDQAAACQREIEQEERELTVLQSRLDALERVHASGEGLYAGVRAVLRAARNGDLALSGLIGTVAETVEVPKEYETAIEVALGGHLQDIIVERWDDAQTAIDYLRRSNSGRATFQPLDSLRPPRRQSLDISDPDLVGIAADLVHFPETVQPVVDQTLGRTVVVRNLEASRRMLRSAGGWTIVTLSGEITRPSGAVTGGGRASEAGLLARERERRSLPKTIATRHAGMQAMRHELDTLAVTVEDTVARVNHTREREIALRLNLRAAEAERERVHREHRAAEAASATLAERALRSRQRRGELVEAARVAHDRAGSARKQAEQLRARVSELQQQLDAEPAGDDDAVGALRAELARTSERIQSLTTSARRASDRASEAARALATREAEIERLGQLHRDDESKRVAIDTEVSGLASTLAEQRLSLPPLEAERARLRGAIEQAERDLDRATESIRLSERERDRATLGVARAQDEQIFLTERIRNDLDLDDPAGLDAVEDTGDPPAEQEINRLRDRLRRMSVVSDDVVEQYKTESERLAYLRGQLEDVEQAAAGLRRVLAELNTRMAEQFNATFREVAAAFEHTFTRLFGGGTARLVLSGSEDGAAGIDIVAQPPGKRLQNLTALSGGERALTAVALLIAIQRVNPSPFCLLDEVDAALDESNVVRFRDELRDLSGGTQYVVITHNRGTIEGADTLYGVTMGNDGVSRVLSLKLEDAIQAVEEYETVVMRDA